MAKRAFNNSAWANYSWKINEKENKSKFLFKFCVRRTMLMHAKKKMHVNFFGNDNAKKRFGRAVST